jgi:hypothetical protein
LISLFYTTAERTIDDPLNLTWGEVHAMDREQYEQWWREVCSLLTTNFYEHGVPPKAGMSEVELLAQFRRLSSLAIEGQLGRDETDGALVYRNTVRISAADHFFPNIFLAKDKTPSGWLSVIDQVVDPKTSVGAMWRVLRNDAQYAFSKLVPQDGPIERHLLENRKEYGFLFQHVPRIKKALYKKHRLKVGELESLVKKGVLDTACLRGVEGLPSSTRVYLRQYRRDLRVFPSAFSFLQKTMVSAPNNFPAVVARAIYQRYALPKEDGAEITIWDPSMGFGGRLLAALSLLDRSIHYIGTDPNSQNYLPDEGTSRYAILERVFKNEVRERRGTFRGTYLQLGSEEAARSDEFRALKGLVDLVFTSPPYFSAERYGEDETQSSIKFDSYHSWRSGFLAPTLKTAAEWLRIGGYAIINIANSGGYPLEEDTRLLFRQLKMKLVASEKMLIALSAGSRRKSAGVLATWNFARVGGKLRKYEPVYVFRKDKDTPDVEKFYFSKLHPRE